MITKKEYQILLNFLKSGLSTRQLDKFLDLSNSKGWNSWKILKKYKLKNFDKGKLFLYSSGQSKKLIKLLDKKEGSIDKLIKENPPNKLKKYENTYVIADSGKKIYDIMSGETRNIIRDFFNPEKKIIKECQFKDCKNKKHIDTVHFLKDRPEIFKECASLNK